MVSDSELAKYVAILGAISSLVLGTWNLAMKSYSKAQPESRLARKVEGGMFNMQVFDYIVGLFGQVVAQPAFWLAAFCNRDTELAWWYGSQRQMEAAGFFGYSLGYFLQDSVLHCHENSVLIVAHHVASILGCFAMVYASSWRGLLISTAQIMELGSISICLGDLGFVRREVGHSINIISSAIPVIWIIVGVVMSCPTDVCTWYCAVGGVIVALLRIKENWLMMQQVMHPPEANLYNVDKGKFNEMLDDEDVDEDLEDDGLEGEELSDEEPVGGLCY